MKKLTRTLLIGSLATALMVSITGTSMAQWGFFGHFGPHHHGGWHGSYYPSVAYSSPVVVESPTVVESNSTYYQPDDTNPAPIISIQLVNPAENRVSLNYRLDDGVLQSLPPGGSITISQITVISFDRGAGAARARYRLTDGMYKFVVAGGLWELVHQAAAYPQTAGYVTQQAGAYANQQAGYSGQQTAGYTNQETASSNQQAVANPAASASPASTN